ncbi:unnamed protein product, partial [Mesorhabditis belari]|uniref:RPGR-interacting protein 1 first C2 domain-containing protein n=1 Tax=Mesorhabditis belari TaxID=2138241 RepID=A0AAF3EZR6_9BILA
MVKRPPVEEWSRAELEDHFHEVFRENIDLQLKTSSLNKQLSQISARFRRPDSKTEVRTVPFEQYADLEKDRQLLQIKLRSLRHQLLTYTHPTARPHTANVITGRSNLGHPATNLRPTSAQSRRLNQEQIRSFRVTETIVAEKATLIKLNRDCREKDGQLIEKEIQIKNKDKKIHQLTMDLEERERKIRSIEAESRSFRETGRNLEENGNFLGEKSICLKCADSAELRAENSLLKQANERLIAQTLDQKIDGGALEIVEIEKKLVANEEELKETKRQLQETERRLRKERNETENLKKMMNKQRSQKENQERVVSERSERDHQLDYLDRLDKLAKLEKRKGKKEKQGDDVLERLWKDVSALIGDHSTQEDSSSTSNQSPIAQNAQKWEQLYAELYDELEKVRNLLLLQHEINQKQGKEMSLLQGENDRLRDEAEQRICEIRDQLAERNKKIVLLESQIRAIAYGKQRLRPILSADPIQSDADASNELTLRFTQVILSKDYLSSFGPSFFFSIEFFDFELQTTNVLSGDRVPLNYTFLYNVVVSKLFLHYIQTDGLQVEMYRPNGGVKCDHLGSSVLSLKSLINSRTGKYAGELKILSLENGHPIATINYELAIARDLTKSLNSYASQETAQKMLTVKTEEKENRIDTLSITIHRCSQIDFIKKENVDLAVVYEFLAFSPYFTDFVRVEKGKAEFNNKRDWALMRGENLGKMLDEGEISIFLVESDPKAGEDGVLAMTVIPLGALVHGKSIRGTFAMMKPNGNRTGVMLDLSVHWKFAPDFLTKPPTIPKEEVIVERKDEKPRKVEHLPPHPSPPPPLSSPPPTSPPRAHLAHSSSSTFSSSSFESTSAKEHIFEEVQPPQLADQASTPSTSRSSQETVILDGPSTHLHEIEEPQPPKEPPQPVPRRSSSGNGGSTKSEAPVEPVKIPSPIASSPDMIKDPFPVVTPPKSPASSKSEDEKDFIKRDPDTPMVSEEEKESSSSSSSGHLKEPTPVKEHELLGELPPIAAPRLTRPKLNETTNAERETKLKFTDPLHDSIPPSDTSELGSTPRKAPIELREAEGKSNLAYRDIREPKAREVIDAWLKIRVEALYVHEDSILLHPEFNSLNVYVDWCLLDFPVESCRVTPSVALPRKSTEAAMFNFEKKFDLDNRRCVLLAQWMRLGNRLEFNLNTDQGDDSDELAVASVEMSPFSRQDRLTIALYDVNGEHVGDLDVGIEYSDSLIEEVRREHEEGENQHQRRHFGNVNEEDEEDEEIEEELIEEHSI